MASVEVPPCPDPPQSQEEEEAYEEISEEIQEEGMWDHWDADEEGRWVCQAEANGSHSVFLPHEIDARVYVRTIPNKGRCLFSRYALKPGDLIYSENPLLSCTRSLKPKLWAAVKKDCEESNTDAMMPASWHYAALYSILYLSVDDRRKILDKWHPPVDPNNISPECLRIVKNVKYARKVDPFEYDRMLQAWRFNCFGHHSDNHGLVLYDRISMMSHCCESSATWHYGQTGDQFVLRARHHIPKDGEISITYVGDDELFKAKDSRRERLCTWLFVCGCVKCKEPEDRARGLRCPSCGGGVVYLTTDDNASTLSHDGANTKITTATNCDSCRYAVDQEEIENYIQFEEAYSARLLECTSDELADCENVLIEAGRVFINHWILFELYNRMHSGYKERKEFELANYFLGEKIRYVENVCNAPSYALAWMHEEYGDLLLEQHVKMALGISLEVPYWDSGNSVPELELSLGTKNRVIRSYESAMNIFLASCGDTHQYTLTAHWKMEYISNCSGKLPPAKAEVEEAEEAAEEAAEEE